MVHLKLKENNGDVLSYYYYPGSLEVAPGVVSIDKASGNWIVESLSPEDDWTEYRSHAFARMERMLEDGDILDYTCSMWY